MVGMWRLFVVLTWIWAGVCGWQVFKDRSNERDQALVAFYLHLNTICLNHGPGVKTALDREVYPYDFSKGSQWVDEDGKMTSIYGVRRSQYKAAATGDEAGADQLASVVATLGNSTAACDRALRGGKGMPLDAKYLKRFLVRWLVPVAGLLAAMVASIWVYLGFKHPIP
ncbi:hypothetical protein ACXU4B_10925 [Dyella soli]|uniref:Uncharacterized protein n=1 Tax=Dyella soli TaxID=522319 RepID=A0A4R0YLX2_9GAMM|nr:hypothetical protein [Dyella soli]TCI07315.1 hypothetical protein EZM97_32495 [Dyella soli]